MDNLNLDLDDSNLFCKSLIPKRKAVENINPKQSKQLKLTFYQASRNTNLLDENNQLNGDSSEEKIKPIKNNHAHAELRGSKSAYFLTKNSTNSCPLCLKLFKSDSAYSAHMKQCARTHRMSTQQLLEALELQKKQLQKRRDLGLSSQIISSAGKNAKKKIKDNKESCDLALGLALSKSLVTCETKAASSQELQKLTLEEFGFRTNAVVTGKRKNENDKNSVLKSRTNEERQKIIVEKVAMILLDEDQGKDFENKKLIENSFVQNTQVPQLWSLGENDEKRDWYVSQIKTLVLEEENTKENVTPIQSDCIDKEILKLCLPQKEIYEDWHKMINNSFKSDLVLRTKDGQDVYLHSLVFFARFPEILEKETELIFEKFNLTTILIFLNYVYCGTLNGLNRSEVSNLYDLAIELNFNELINVMNNLKSNLSEECCNKIRNSPLELKSIENNANNREICVIENKKLAGEGEKDLFIEDVVDLTQSSPEPEKVCGSQSESESNPEKSYWSFIQHEKKKNLGEIIGPEEKNDTREISAKEVMPMASEIEEDEKDFISSESTKMREMKKQFSDDSATKDLVDVFQNQKDKMNNSDCITLSSGSESKASENFVKSQRDCSKTPSSIGFDCEVPYFDPFEHFHCFSEEQFSSADVNSQSLLIGDISTESLKLSNAAQEDPNELNDSFKEEPKRTVGYCSTPVSIRRASKIKSSAEKTVRSDKRKNRTRSSCFLGSRILRKSLGLQHKTKNSKYNSSFKKNSQRRIRQTKDFAEALTNSIFNELSKSISNSPFSNPNKFVEVTPTASREEFGESVTPYPNYSNMGEAMLKEQLTKYGLKKNLAKRKAQKILRHIYEELHPFYNIETGKIVKMLPNETPKSVKKSKTRGTCSKSAKPKRSKNNVLEKKKQEKKEKDYLNSSKESGLISDGTIPSLDGPNSHESDGSEFDDLNETLTQSMPSNPVDLPSAFYEFIQNNSEYYEKILLYEPIWLEELQKKLKEVFRKHFKISDIIDFLDQKCITFRSEAQLKNNQKRNEKRKFKKKKKII